MTTIQWTEAMSVGVEALDDDHKHLIHLINGLHYSDTGFVELFNELLDYVGGHFEREEQFLDSIGYPGLDGHRGQHDVFADQVSAMLKQYRAEGFTDTDQRVADFLWTWLKGHILIEDLKYAAWAKAKAG
ncbi:hemerythrin [Paramagnetospirillum kuznetsovii]|uniref:Hemerythrin n=1 Tax=Paramagnetospirillum kuznetsovii TaxID=2053833 RepID=A0A364P1J3_9PROT|nr:bacteriohemerythrin [Paramagnetospirillum kuznetsovii]RAU23191.1 hemerythrin [Paramagnetospirillum kuznetsovii]